MYKAKTFMYHASLPARVDSEGGYGGQKTPSRIMLGKPKQWCNGIKMP